MAARISSLLRQLEQLSVQKGVRDELQQVLDDLAPLAEAQGLDTAQVARGYDLALGGHLLPSQSLALLPSLLPRQPLAAQPILRILSSLGEPAHVKPLHKGRVDYKVQKRALGQLSVLLQAGAVGKDGKEVLERCWGIIERGLEYRALRDVSATLLCLITRRMHVQEARISHLQHVIRSTEAPPSSLFRLLDIFRSFSPELVLPSGATRIGGSGGLGKALEEWREKVKATLSEGEGELDAAAANGRSAKRRKTSQAAIPLPATYVTSSSATPLSDITSITGLVSQIEKLDLPSQAGSVLSAVPGGFSTESVRSEEDRTKAWALLIACGYGGDDGQLLRLDSFLAASLRHELYELDETPEGELRVEDLLCRMRELCEMGGELTEGLEPFLADYLTTWDGEAHREVIFDLIALQKPCAFEVFYSHILAPLQALAVSANAEWLARWVQCLQEVVLAWAVRSEWGGSDLKTVFSEFAPNVAYYTALQALLEYADHAIELGTQAYPTSIPLRCAAFAFYETALSLPLEHQLAVVIIPSPIFTYLCLVADDATSVSRIAGLIHTLREVLTGASTCVATEDRHNADLVTFLNSYLKDFVNALWQKKLLSQTDTEAMNLSTAQIDAITDLCKSRGQALGPALGLTVHAALSSLALNCLAQLEEKDQTRPRYAGGAVSVPSLKHLAAQGGLNLPYTDFRVAFLDYLQYQEKGGAEGLQAFLYASLAKLKSRQSGDGSQSQGYREDSVMSRAGSVAGSRAGSVL